jgi:ABC-type transport system involved in multi-copper enzyme maturation permease subunit
MSVIAAIARNTFREALRDRILYLFFGFSVIILVGSKLLGLLTVGDEGKVIKDLGLAGIQFFSMLIAVMMSVLLISREVDSRMVFNILAKPLERWQFLLGKYLGLMLTVVANLALMTVLFLAVVTIYGAGLDPGLLLAAVMTLVEMAVLAAFAVLFAVVTKPILGSVLTLAVFVIGHLSEDIWMLTRHLPSQAGRTLVAAVYYLLPNLERFNFKAEAVHSLAVSPAVVVWSLAYGVLYTALVLLLACLHFGRKDLV